MGRDIGIIFSQPMVLALLSGRKVMTRRLAWQDALFCACNGRRVTAKRYNPSGIRICPRCGGSGGLIIKTVPTVWQSVRPGDRLWVRENWNTATDLETKEVYPIYAASDNLHPALRWRPSIHTPRRYSRITLAVTAVKIEALQAISEADAIAEGIEPVDREGYPRAWKSYEHYSDGKPHPHAVAANKSPVTSFRELWQWLHGHETWAQNPEVVAISFRVHQANIDALKVVA